MALFPSDVEKSRFYDKFIRGEISEVHEILKKPVRRNQRVAHEGIKWNTSLVSYALEKVGNRRELGDSAPREVDSSLPPPWRRFFDYAQDTCKLLDKRSLLRKAISFNVLEAVQVLGAKLRVEGKFHTLDPNCRHTYLTWAIKEHKGSSGLAVVGVLVEELNADINQETREGWTPLAVAVDEGRHEVLKKLLSHVEIDPNKKIKRKIYGSKGTETVLHLALQIEDKAAVDILMEHGSINCNLKDSLGQLPLHLAITNQYRDVALKMVTEDSSKVLAFKDRIKEQTPLHLACSEGYTEVVKAILAISKTTVKMKDAKMQTPLHVACAAGHFHIVEILLGIFDNAVSYQDDIGQTPLHLACAKGHTEIVRALLRIPRTKLSVRDLQGVTPLHAALANQHQAVASEIINAATTSSRAFMALDDRKQTPYHMAGSRRYSALLKKMLVAIRNDMKDDQWQALFRKEISLGHCEVANEILRISQSRSEHLCTLASHGKKHSILFYAQANGQFEMETLLENEKDCPKLSHVILNGSPSLLWLAANSGRDETFKLLLKYLKLEDKSQLPPKPAPGGTNILEIALCKGHNKIIDLAMTHKISTDNQEEVTLYNMQMVRDQAIKLENTDVIKKLFPNDLDALRSIEASQAQVIGVGEKLFDLSRKFPMFNEDALPANRVKDIIVNDKGNTYIDVRKTDNDIIDYLCLGIPETETVDEQGLVSQIDIKRKCRHKGKKRENCSRAKNIVLVCRMFETYLEEKSPCFKGLGVSIKASGSLVEGTRICTLDEADCLIFFKELVPEHFKLTRSAVAYNVTEKGKHALPKQFVNDDTNSFNFFMFYKMLLTDLHQFLENETLPDGVTAETNFELCSDCGIDERPFERLKHCKNCLPAVTFTKAGLCGILKDKGVPISIDLIPVLPCPKTDLITLFNKVSSSLLKATLPNWKNYLKKFIKSDMLLPEVFGSHRSLRDGYIAFKLLHDQSDDHLFILRPGQTIAMENLKEEKLKKTYCYFKALKSVAEVDISSFSLKKVLLLDNFTDQARGKREEMEILHAAINHPHLRPYFEGHEFKGPGSEEESAKAWVIDFDQWDEKMGKNVARNRGRTRDYWKIPLKEKQSLIN